jgi:hypothetical protein
MPKSQLAGRRIHIAGSISSDAAIASTEEVRSAREFVRILVAHLVRRGATFVVPVDAEKVREIDGEPICFDWLVWQAIYENIVRRPADAKEPLVVAVQHNKNERQIPEQFETLWDTLRSSDLVYIENASHWNMNSKRMEAQAKQGDILLTLGGTEGVLFLANLYHEAGKPVIPLSFALGIAGQGSSRLTELGMSSAQADRLFRVTNLNPHTWMNRMNWTKSKSLAERAEITIELLEALEPPVAFAVRLLNQTHKAFNEVQLFFEGVVQPVVEGERGYKLVVVDGEQPFEQSRMDQEIFVRLHRSSLVLADITGDRLNCYLELGYALGRGLPTMLTVMEGASHPFDIYSVAALHWKTTGTLEERREAFRKHWDAIRSRPALVPPNPLVW